MAWSLPVMSLSLNNLGLLLILPIRTTLGSVASMRTPMRGGPCRLIRQYIPKSCPISIIPHTDVAWIQDQLNNRPRKSLGYLTPAQFGKNQLYALEM